MKTAAKRHNRSTAGHTLAPGPRRVAGALVACAGVALAGCGGSPATPPPAVAGSVSCNLPLCGAAAKTYVALSRSPFGQYLDSLSVLTTTLVVYLPLWTPPLPPDECTQTSASTSMTAYSIELWLAPCSGAGPAGPPAFPPPSDVYAWLISGGQQSGSGTAPIVTPSGAPTRTVSLGSGVTASYWPGTALLPTAVLRWQQGAWTYEVTYPGSVQQGDGAVVGAARSMWSQVRKEVTPVPSEESGTVVEQIGGPGTPIWVTWGSVDAAYYTVAGPDTSALEMANAMVRVSFPG